MINLMAMIQRTLFFHVFTIIQFELQYNNMNKFQKLVTIAEF